jgi:hypothetical protein
MKRASTTKGGQTDYPDFTKTSPDEVRSQLRRTAALLDAAGADDPRPLFRFPYGARDDARDPRRRHEQAWSQRYRSHARWGKTDGRGAPLAHRADIRAQGYEFVDLRTAVR